MGREAEGRCNFAGQTGACKFLLESKEIILRGEIRARIQRSGISGFRQDLDDLVIDTDQGMLRMTLGVKNATSWAKALATPPPDLAKKLGISRDRPAFVIGGLTDAELIVAVDANKTHNADEAAALIAELPSRPAFDQVFIFLQANRKMPFWAVTIKGKASEFSESELRRLMRAAGTIDVKSCSVSDRMSATCFHWR